MALKSVEQAVADLIHLEGTAKAYTNLQRAMNALGAHVNALSEERRKDVVSEIEESITDWMAGGMPHLDVPDLAPEVTPVARRPNNLAGCSGNWKLKNGRAAYGTGASAVIVQLLRENGPTKTGEIVAAIAGKFQTCAKKQKNAIYAALHVMSRGKYARLTRDVDGRYAVLPGR
jgi:hypothetical protein